MLGEVPGSCRRAPPACCLVWDREVLRFVTSAPDPSRNLTIGHIFLSKHNYFISSFLLKCLTFFSCSLVSARTSQTQWCGDRGHSFVRSSWKLLLLPTITNDLIMGSGGCLCVIVSCSGTIPLSNLIKWFCNKW